MALPRCILPAGLFLVLTFLPAVSKAKAFPGDVPGFQHPDMILYGFPEADGFLISHIILCDGHFAAGGVFMLPGGVYPSGGVLGDDYPDAG